MKLVKCMPEFFFTEFLKNRKISSKIKRSNVTDYAALKLTFFWFVLTAVHKHSKFILPFAFMHKTESLSKNFLNCYGMKNSSICLLFPLFHRHL